MDWQKSKTFELVSRIQDFEKNISRSRLHQGFTDRTSNMGNTGLEFECCSVPGGLVIKIHIKVSITMNAIIVLVIKIIFMSFQGRATPWQAGHIWIRY